MACMGWWYRSYRAGSEVSERSGAYSSETSPV
jgi:hypothetical protein